MTNKAKIAFFVLASLTMMMLLMSLLSAFPRHVLANSSARIVCFFWHQMQTDEDRYLQTCSTTTP